MRKAMALALLLTLQGKIKTSFDAVYRALEAAGQ